MTNVSDQAFEATIRAKVAAEIRAIAETYEPVNLRLATLVEEVFEVAARLAEGRNA